MKVQKHQDHNPKLKNFKGERESEPPKMMARPPPPRLIRPTLCEISPLGWTHLSRNSKEQRAPESIYNDPLKKTPRLPI